MATAKKQDEVKGPEMVQVAKDEVEKMKAFYAKKQATADKFKRTAARKIIIMKKAVAAGIVGEQVDGNDVIAVGAAVGRALVRARQGLGPTLVEALTYRLCDHTTADDASRYRDDAEVSRHWPAEPLVRLRNFLVHSGHWDKAAEEALLHECTDAVERAAADYLATAPQSLSANFDFVYATAPAELAEQRKSALALEGEA